MNDEDGKQQHVAVIMCVFNRVSETLACLDSLFAQDARDVRLTVHLVDDGSTDGTARALAETYDSGVTVIQGDGDQYWSKSMAIAQSDAELLSPDAILWLNNDVTMDRDALRRLLATADESHEAAIVCAATRDPLTGKTTYSGYRKMSSRPGDLELVEPQDHAAPVDTMNGNIVLVPRRVYKKLGAVDSSFAHGMGDWDYGLRARRHGVPVFLAPGHYGFCERNSVTGTWEDRQLRPSQRIRHLLSVKGVPFRSLMRYTARHGGWRWPIFLCASYARIALRIAVDATMFRKRS